MLPFWILTLAAVAFIAVIIALVLDSEGTATFISIIALAIAGWFMWPTVKEFFSQPEAFYTVTWYVVGYLVIGFIFSFIKWIFYSRAAAKTFAEWRAANPNRSDYMNDSSHRAIKVKVVEGVATTTIDQEKLIGRVVSWTSYWPAHAILLILDDLIRNIVDVVVRMNRKLFEGITKWAFSGLK